MIKFSIITVCFNAEKEIGETITSVLNQTCTDFEYLIQDGLSKDGTVGIAESFAPAFAERGIPFRIVSQKDGGIYDAMNRAVFQARGEWVNFMNAGDQFTDKSVLERVEKSGALENADVVYGDRILRKGTMYRYQKAYALEEMRIGLPFCHQSAFTRKECFLPDGYSTKYRICSDYHFYLRLYREGGRFAYLAEAVSIFATGGTSSDWKRNRQEKIQILEEMPVRDQEAIDRIREQDRQETHAEAMHNRLWKYVPQTLRQMRRTRMDRQAGWKPEKEFWAEYAKQQQRGEDGTML